MPKACLMPEKASLVHALCPIPVSDVSLEGPRLDASHDDGSRSCVVMGLVLGRVRGSLSETKGLRFQHAYLCSPRIPRSHSLCDPTG